MRRCLGPCCGLGAPAAYAERGEGTLLFLRGRSQELVPDLDRRMQAAARAERFEEAGRLRDRIAAVERTVERQQIVGERPVDRDVFGIARRGGEALVQVLLVREGRVVGAHSYGFSDVRIDDGEVMGSFLGQYYAPESARPLPSEVLVPLAIEEAEALEGLLAEQAGRKVAVRQPQRGALVELVAMAATNAEHALMQRLEARESVEAALEELRERLGLRRLPRRIEGYDISTLQGSLSVGSRVAFEDGQPEKSGYRRFRIREAAPDDDTACLREVLGRRFARAASDPLPDLVMIDGGKGQLAVAQAAARDAGLEVELLSLAKERDLQSPSPRVRRSGGLKAERVFLPERKDPVLLPPSSRGLLLLQRVRDEAHRFAIEFQRDLRSRRHLASVLEELPGIGPKKRRALLRALGSLRAVREASDAELAAVPGIAARDADAIRRFLAALEAPEPAEVE
jgi:excinuclease ABC subunit C